jgi:hypothetical protein
VRAGTAERREDSRIHKRRIEYRRDDQVQAGPSRRQEEQAGSSRRQVDRSRVKFAESLTTTCLQFSGKWRLGLMNQYQLAWELRFNGQWLERQQEGL